ncbi:MAG: hypothetical protein ACTS6J_20380 [Burkholderiales bacterium]
MKKAKDNEMRRSYKRSDFAKLERGKFHAEVVRGTSVALLDPAIAKAFPTSRAVNEALAGLLALTEQTSRITRRSTRTRGKAPRAG